MQFGQDTTPGPFTLKVLPVLMRLPEGTTIQAAWPIRRERVEFVVRALYPDGVVRKQLLTPVPSPDPSQTVEEYCQMLDAELVL